MREKNGSAHLFSHLMEDFYFGPQETSFDGANVSLLLF